MLQPEETKQIKLDLNSSKYNKLKVLETKIISTYICGLRPSINPLGLVLLLGVGLSELPLLSRWPAHRLLLHFKQFSRDHIIINTKNE